MTVLQDYIDKLRSDDEADRIYAAEDIGYANQEAGVGPLLGRLPKEPSRAVREAILAALQQIEHDAVIDGALALLDSEDSFLRNQAVEILRARGPRSIPYLDRAFREGSCDRRKFIIDILAGMRDDAGSQIYDLALKDSDLNVLITAVEGLGNKRKAEFRGRIEILLSPSAHPMLLSACLEALAQIGDDTSVEAVRSSLGTASGIHGYLLPSYLKLLGARGCPRDVAEVAEMIGREEMEPTVLNALHLLQSRYPRLALPTMLAVPLQDIVSRNTSPLLSYHAIRLLAGFHDDPAVFDFLERHLEASEKSIRIGAVQAMREAGTAKASAVLDRRLASETDEEVLQAWGKSR